MGQSKLMMIAHIGINPLFKQFTAVFGISFRQNIFFVVYLLIEICLPYQIALVRETIAGIEVRRLPKRFIFCFLEFQVPGRICNEIIFIAVHQGDRRADPFVIPDKKAVAGKMEQKSSFALINTQQL